jgi:hypothetical protein
MLFLKSRFSFILPSYPRQTADHLAMNLADYDNHTYNTANQTFQVGSLERGIYGGNALLGLLPLAVLLCMGRTFVDVDTDSN